MAVEETNPVKGDAYHDTNSGLLSVLPLLLCNLVSRESVEERLLKRIDDELKPPSPQSKDRRIFQQRLQSLKDQLIGIFQDGAQDGFQKPVGLPGGLQKDAKIKLDANKSIMLNLMYGSMYNEALTMYQERLIQILVLSDGPDDCELLKKFIETQDFTNAVFIKVADPTPNVKRNLLDDPILTSDLKKPLTVFDIRYQLRQLGLKLNNDWILQKFEPTIEKQQQPPPLLLPPPKRLRLNPSTQHLVDVKTWYCSCTVYQLCYHNDYRMKSMADLMSKMPDSPETQKLQKILVPEMKNLQKLPFPMSFILSFFSKFFTFCKLQVLATER
ncbi:hypothetical protein QCA50_020861 [Cerrena zonata]|uniref:Uncharacterized protein n=1 Tax=Cerrena zonata TaxID=2478898 RepID=A0AAW0FBC6_9APHY